MEYIIGIDIGKKGGICIMYKKTRAIIKLLPMPLRTDGDIDGDVLLDIFKKCSGGCHCFIEKLHAMPFFGAKGNFGFGGQYYTIKTILRISKTPFTEVIARMWQKDLFEAMKVQKKSDGKNDTKKMAAIRAQDLYPDTNFLATNNSKKIHDGMIDAALIAYYGSKHF